MKLKSLKIGDVLLQNNVALAPMAGFTDKAFRSLCFSLGAGLCVTEMVSAKGLIYKNDHTRELLACGDDLDKTACQIFGGEPDIMRAACESEELAPFKIIDINMGCPVPKIFNNGEGSSLLGDVNRAAKIISECAKSGKIITVKFRVGIADNGLIAPLFAKTCEDNGAKAITIHGRTRQGMYSGEIFYDQIEKAKNSVNIPVFANGGIFSENDAGEMLQKTGADGVAIARGALYNPLLFSKLCGVETQKTLKDCAFYLLDERVKYMPDKIAAHGMRKLLSQMLRGVRGGKEAKLKIFEAETCAEIKDILNELEGAF